LKKILLLLLFVSFGVHGGQENNSTAVIEGNKISSKIKDSLVIVEGDVKITQQNNYSITADDAILDKKNKKIYLNGKVRLWDKNNNNNIFAKKAELSDDFKNGTFDDVGFVMGGGMSILSERMVKEDDSSYLGYNSEYYFCPTENLDINLPHDDIIEQLRKNKVQLFSIHSEKSHIDRKKRRTYMNNAYIKFLNIPFFYTPYMSTSKKLDDRVSGPSMPHLSKHGTHSYGFHFPLEFYFFDNLDILLEPTIYMKGNFLEKTTIKYKKDGKFYLNLKHNYVYDGKQSKHMKNTSGVSEVDEGKYKNNRNSLNLTSRALLENNIHLIADLNYAHDPYLLRDYFCDYRETLRSNLNLFRIYDNSHINFDLLAFQQIGERNNAGVFETPLLVPLLEYSYDSRNTSDDMKLKFKLNSRILDSYSHYGNRYGKMNFDTSLVYSDLFNGLHATADFSLYSDVYYRLNVNGRENSGRRFYPEFAVKLLYPVSLFGKIEMIPILQYFISSRKTVNFTDIDSKGSELTMNNLFSKNRYSGHDLTETGGRINYGLKTALSTAMGHFSLTVGQGYRDFIDSSYRINYFNRKFSYLLTTLDYRYNNISVNYTNYIDDRTYRIDRGDTIVSLNYGEFSCSISYNHVSKKVSISGRNEELMSLNLRFTLTKKLYSGLTIGRDLERRNFTGIGITIGYEDNCYRTEFILDKQDFADPYAKNNWPAFRFNFGIKN
jgi:LPS-assembly protein